MRVLGLWLLSTLFAACAAEAPLAPAECAAGAPPAAPRAAGDLNSDGSPKKLPPGPPSEPPYTLVLDYYDFGPQALSFGLIGMSWWQWEGGGSWEPGDSFDVRVVVYRGRSREEVERAYPTVRDRSDYRLVPYEDAMDFFGVALRDPDIDGALKQELAATRGRIVAALGAP
jgi:hypothetical protein